MEDLAKLRELDSAIRATIESLLHDNKVWHFNAYGWRNAYDADPEFVGHAMWQVEPAVDLSLRIPLELRPSLPELWKIHLSTSGADFEGVMRSARNSIGLMLFQMALRPAVFAPDNELFDLHRVSSIIYLSTATDRLREFFTLAAFRQTSGEYERRGQLFLTSKRSWYQTPFEEAQYMYQSASTDLMEPINSLVSLVPRIREIRDSRNILIHEITTDLARREKQLVDGTVAWDKIATFEEIQAAQGSIRKADAEQTASVKRQLTTWYALLMKAINDAYIFEHYRRRQ